MLGMTIVSSECDIANCSGNFTFRHLKVAIANDDTFGKVKSIIPMSHSLQC